MRYSRDIYIYIYNSSNWGEYWVYNGDMNRWDPPLCYQATGYCRCWFLEAWMAGKYFFVRTMACFIGRSGWCFGTFGLFFHSVGNFIIPTDEFKFFRGVGIPPTSRLPQEPQAARHDGMNHGMMSGRTAVRWTRVVLIFIVTKVWMAVITWQIFQQFLASPFYIYV